MAETYLPRRPCPRGHTGPRYFKTWSCIECATEKAREKAARIRAARAPGSPRTVVGRPCKYGHTRRYVIGGACADCPRQRRLSGAGLVRSHAYHLLASARSRAKKLNLPFDLDIEFVESLVRETTHCPALGLELAQSVGRGRLPESRSLDRFVPERGYVKGNVSLVSLRANILKRDATADELEAVARWMRGRS